jgi:hypothetical protein
VSYVVRGSQLCRAARLAVLFLVILAGAARGVSLDPLTTQTAETVPGGTMQAGLGVSYFNDMRFPFFTPAGTLQRQTLLGAPQLAAYIGVADRVEIQARYELLYLDEKTSTGETNSTYGSGDARLFTKVRIMHARGLWPAFGVRFGTKLPNANKNERLGTDDTDFEIEGLVSRTFGPVSVHLNLGILLLGNPGSLIGNRFDAGGQDDLFTYGLALASKPLAGGTLAALPDTDLRLLGEVVGQTGSRYDNNRDSARFGLQLRHDDWTVYSGVSAGLETGAENVGASTGVLYSFEPAKLFGE